MSQNVAPSATDIRVESFFKQHMGLSLNALGATFGTPASPKVLGEPAETDPLFAIACSGQAGTLPVPRYVFDLCLAVRNLNREMFHTVENGERVQAKAWRKTGSQGEAQGGGVMSLLRGQTLEKAAVNASVVWGPEYPSIEKDYAGKPYIACGVSLICHPLNPNAPIAHMNIRTLTVGAPGQGQVTWIGGGADLTPMVQFEDDTRLFHDAMRSACQRNKLGDYDRYRSWCDEYFFIPHRGETRGVGGIFFDYLHVGSPDDFQLLLDVGQEFAQAYGTILARRVALPYDEALKEKHLYWRGRYAEFNLAYDRGTRFGLLSGGNTEAIFASLPPIVKW